MQISQENINSNYLYLADSLITNNESVCKQVQDLPEELIMSIFAFLKTTDFKKTVLVCSKWKRLSLTVLFSSKIQPLINLKLFLFKNVFINSSNNSEYKIDILSMDECLSIKEIRSNQSNSSFSIIENICEYIDDLKSNEEKNDVILNLALLLKKETKFHIVNSLLNIFDDWEKFLILKNLLKDKTFYIKDKHIKTLLHHIENIDEDIEFYQIRILNLFFDSLLKQEQYEKIYLFMAALKSNEFKTQIYNQGYVMLIVLNFIISEEAKCPKELRQRDLWKSIVPIDYEAPEEWVQDILLELSEAKKSEIR